MSTIVNQAERNAHINNLVAKQNADTQYLARIGAQALANKQQQDQNATYQSIANQAHSEGLAQGAALANQSWLQKLESWFTPAPQHINQDAKLDQYLNQVQYNNQHNIPSSTFK